MADVSVKMGVNGISQFKSNLKQAQESAKTLGAQMKSVEAQYEATGKKSTYLSEKGKLLKQMLDTQKKAAQEAQKALEEMRKKGVEQTSKEYQEMERALANAETSMYKAQAGLDGLASGEEKAATGAKSLNTELGNLNKKVSLDQVINGIGTITGALESAAGKAKQLGESIWENVLDAAKWADDTATLAEMYDIPLDTYLRMQKLVDEGLDTSVDAMLKSMSVMRKGIGKESKEMMSVLKDLHLVTTENFDTGFGIVQRDVTLYKDSTDLFWKAGQAIMNMSDAFDKEAAAQALFGRSWHELVPLFNKYKSLEEYNAALAETTPNSEEAVTKLAELNDKISEMESAWNTLKVETISALAPALEAGAEAISTLLKSLTEYLQTPEGQQALENLGTAVEGLFQDLNKIDPQQVVEGFAGVFNDIVEGLQWLDKNSGTVITAMASIIGGWAVLKITGGALQMLQLLNGLKELKGTKKITMPDIDGGENNLFGDTSNVTTENVTTENVTTQNITNQNTTTGNFTTANFTTGNTTTEHVQTMYVANMIGGNTGQTPGTNPFINNGSNGRTLLPYVQPTGLESGGSGLNGYAPLMLPNGRSVGGGEELRLPGVDNVTIDGNGTNFNFPETGNNDLIQLDPSDYSIEEGSATFWQTLAMSVGKAAQGITAADPTGVSALIPQWLADNTTLGRALQEGKTLDEAAGEAAKAIQQLPQEAWNRYQETVDNQYKALFGLDTKELGEKAAEIYHLAEEKADEAWQTIKSYAETYLIKPIEEGLDKAVEKERTINIRYTPNRLGGGGNAYYDLGIETGHFLKMGGFANGISYVPFDGYMAMLHKGERVVPARENNGSRSFSSNLYVESMYMNNGTDAEGLAAAMAAAQKRTLRGYGS